MRSCPRFSVLRGPRRVLLRVFLLTIRSNARLVSPRIHFTGGMAGWLATRNQLSENVGILSMIEAEGKLREVQRQIRCADFVEASHYAALEQTPKAFNRVRMDHAAN